MSEHFIDKTELEVLTGETIAAAPTPPPEPLLRRAFSIEFICGALLTIITVLMFIEVFTRYVFAYPLTWSDEVVAIAFTWLCFLSAAIAVKHRGHIAVQFILHLFPASIQRWITLLTGLLVIVFLGLLVVTGFKIMLLVHHQTSASMELPLSLTYASLPVSAILMLFYELRHIAASLKGGRAL